MINMFYEKAEKFVVDSFTKIGLEYQIPHFKQTVYWVEQLTDASEALRIAAVSHDIDRAFTATNHAEREKKGFDFSNISFLRPHEERCAKVIGEFLEKEGAQEELIEKVKELVSRHEEGGTKGQNILKDADSISFFENNINHFLEVKVKQLGKEKIKQKFEWMYNRISSDKAKDICHSWYEDALKRLE
jgi:hypothetical protein